MTQDTSHVPGGALVDQVSAPSEATLKTPSTSAPQPTRVGGSIFISYASGDLSVAREIRRYLEQGGYSCWMAPDSVRGPKPWAEQIVDAIHDCQAMIVLMSSHSNASTHVSKELQLASEQAKPLLPVRVEDINPSGSMEYLLALAQWVDAFPGPIADHAAVLREGVAAIFAAAGVPAPDAPPVDTSTLPQRSCPSCGTPAANSERFCGQCGRSFESVAPSAPTPPLEPVRSPVDRPTLSSILTGRSGRGLQIGVIVAALVVVAAAIFGITALGGDDTPTEEVVADESPPATEPLAPATTPTTPPTPTATVAPTPVTSAPVVTPVSLVPSDVGPDTFVENFDGELEEGWSWMSEVPANWSLSTTPGVLRIRATGAFPAENVLVRPAPAASFEATTVVDFRPSVNYQLAGLTVVDGPLDFVQLGRGFCNQCVGDGIYFDLVLDGVMAGDSWLAIDPADMAYLRIESDGDSYTGFYSADGRSWTAVGTHTVTFSSPQVGLVAHQSSIAAAAEFEYFTVTSFGDPIPTPHMVSVFELQNGDCFNDPTGTSSFSEVPVIDCGAPHDNEIYAVFDYVGSDTFPGESAIEAYVQDECIERFEDFVGIDYYESVIWYSAFWPSEGSWGSGDREIICFLYEGDLSKITGSLEGAAR